MVHKLRTKIVIAIMIYITVAAVWQAAAFYIANGNKSIFIAAIALNSLVSLVITVVLIRFSFPSRFQELKEEIAKVRDPQNPTNRLAVQGDDEFTDLAQNINSLLDDLEKFKLAIDNSTDHITINDKDLKILYANKAVEKLTGYPISEVIGKTPALWHAASAVEEAKKYLMCQKRSDCYERHA